MFYPFHTKDVNKNYLNYSMATCYIMFTADFFIYLFLGYYLQNVIPHEYGVAKPWYFIFLPSYWCGDCCYCCCCSKKKTKKVENEKIDEKMKNYNEEKVKNGKNLNGSIESVEIG